MKWPIITCLAGAIILSSCSSTLDDKEDSSDYVLMPSMGRGANRQNAQKLKVVEEQAEEATAVASTTTPSPTPAQQAKAIELLQKDTPTSEASQSNTTATVDMPNVLRAEPVLHPEADAEAGQAPPPNAVELRGLRSPSLPSNLPMNF